LKGKLTLFIAVFLIVACFASAQDFDASGIGSVNACACKTATESFVVKNTGSAAANFNIQQSGNAVKYLVSAPLSFVLKPGKEQVVATVFSAPCGTGKVYQVKNVISNGISAKQLSQQFNVQLCGNAAITPVKKSSINLNLVVSALWLTTAGKALIFLPIMVIIIVLVVALAKKFSDDIREKKSWEQPERLVLKQPKHYFWEKMFPPEEEPVVISAPKKTNWRLILAILALVILVALLALATYFAAKSNLLAIHSANVTKNVTQPGTVAKNITAAARNITTVVAANSSGMMNFSKFTGALGSFAKWVGREIGKPVVKYSAVGVVAAVILIAIIMFFRIFIQRHWKLLLLIILALGIIAGVSCYVYWHWAKVMGWLSGVGNFFAVYWLYIVSGLVVLGVIIAVILAVRSEDSGEALIEQATVTAATLSKKKKSRKRKK
jgi:hypothetical protein